MIAVGGSTGRNFCRMRICVDRPLCVKAPSVSSIPGSPAAHSPMSLSTCLKNISLVLLELNVYVCDSSPRSAITAVFKRSVRVPYIVQMHVRALSLLLCVQRGVFLESAISMYRDGTLAWCAKLQ